MSADRNDALFAETTRPAARDPRWVRLTVLAIGLTFFAVFMVLPLLVVFTEALQKGWPSIWQPLWSPMRSLPFA